MSALVVDDDFRAARATTTAPPTRFLVSLTERCQLRCVHCITDAPTKTSAGTARELGPRVLERLAPHLAHAAYVGLTHAGEPILAPLFDALLDELARARQGAPTVVHLLTNGLAMTEARFVDVVARGVRSLSFSLEGTSAFSNDVVRIGARADVLWPRVDALVARRREGKLDVRMGVACVVTALNVDDLVPLVERAHRAGLDWVKLEELFVDDGAPPEKAALAVPPHVAMPAVMRAVARGRALGMPVLEHVRPMTVWKCQLALDRTMRERSALDDRVNRVDINACRLPWEQVCVEPSGEVRPVTFHHDVAGNLVDEDLLTLWSGPVFARVREETRRMRMCGDGPATCPRDDGPSSW